MLPGTTIGNFQIRSRLGRGGMGEVWLAEQIEVGTRVAIKVLLPEISEDEVHVQRFFNEARAVSRIQHAGIVRIFDVGHADGRAYLIMELLEGETLAQRLRRARPSLAQIGDIGRQIASVLEATHGAGVTHRDLKPDNIFLVRDREMPHGERVKVLDFGIAKLSGTLAGASPRTMGTLGTPAYMAPEQWGDASRVDWRADLYSLGCLAFELVCGRPPFIATNLAEACAQHLHDTPPRASALVPSIPAALDELLAALLAKRPADRPARIRDVMHVFAALAESSAPAFDATLASPLAVDRNASTVASLAPSTAGRRSRVPMVVAALVTTLMAGGIAAAVVSRGPTPTAPALEIAAEAPTLAPPSESATRHVDAPPAGTPRRARARRAAPAQTSRIEAVLPPPDPQAQLPLAPTIDEMKAVLTPLEHRALACGTRDSPARIDMQFLIMPNGKLARATPLGSQAHTELGRCVSDALIRARFPVTQRGALQTFTFALR